MAPVGFKYGQGRALGGGGGQQEPRPSRWLSPWQQLVPAGEGPRNPSQAARAACIPGEGMLLPA